MAGIMVIWGQTWLRSYLVGGYFIAYWVVCLIWVGLAVFTAFVDARATRRRSREEHLALWDQTFGGVRFGGDRAMRGRKVKRPGRDAKGKSRPDRRSPRAHHGEP